MTNGDQYTKAHIDTQRDALAMSIHAARCDGAAVAMVWNASEQRQLLVHQLARLPYLLTKGLAAGYGEELDFEEQVEEIVRGLPRTVAEVDELIDGDRPFADEHNQED